MAIFPVGMGPNAAVTSTVNGAEFSWPKESGEVRPRTVVVPFFSTLIVTDFVTDV